MLDLTKVNHYSFDIFRGINDPVGDNIGEHGKRVYLQLKILLEGEGFNTEIDQKIQTILAAALTHDVLEDTSQTENELLEVVGADSLKIVKELTISFDNKTVKEAVFPLQDISLDAYLVKMSDMLDTARKTLFYIPTNGKKWYEEFYFPLAHEFKFMNKIYLSKMKNYPFYEVAVKLDREFNDSINRLKYFVDMY